MRCDVICYEDDKVVPRMLLSDLAGPDYHVIRVDDFRSTEKPENPGKTCDRIADPWLKQYGMNNRKIIENVLCPEC